MSNLEPPHRFALSAAIGWLELGNPKESLNELDALPPVLRNHPATLEVRWRIDSALNHWTEALAVAEALVRLDPENPSGWIHRAYCLHELKRTQEAWDCLLPAAKKFPRIGTVPYNLACYACQLGRTTLALQWLRKASRLLGKKRLRQMAAKDPDLEPIRSQIKEL